MTPGKFTDTWKRRVTFRGLSIQQRLPFLICILLLSVIITFSYISYVGVRNAAIETGRERLTTLVDELSAMLARTSEDVLLVTRTAAIDETIIKGLESREPVSKIDALTTLARLRPDSTWVLSELIATNRNPILRSARGSILSRNNFDSIMRSLSLRDYSGIGKLYWLKDSIYYPVIVPVRDDKRLIGYLVRWRLIATNQRSLHQLEQLIGINARLYVGNNDGTLWTNFVSPVPYQPIDTDKMMQQVIEYPGRNGNPVTATIRPIANTSWLVAVELSKQLVMEPATRFLRLVIILGGGLTVAGIFIAWRMSRNLTRPLNQLTAAAERIANGDYSTTVAIERRDEVGKLSRAFNAMIGEVSKAKLGLEQKVIEAIRMNEELRELSAYLQNVREDERIHIAREMHDELGQLLTGFKMDVVWLKKRLSDTEDPAVTGKMETLLKAIDESIKFVRTLAAELRPSILDDFGLVPALEWHSQEFQKRYNIKVEFDSQWQELKTTSLIATGLYRMYQESLTNVARHSDATNVVARLSTINGDIRLSITDNGKGFDPSLASNKTLGLLGMKERAAMLGGTVEINSEPGKGTVVIITVKQANSLNVPVS